VAASRAFKVVSHPSSLSASTRVAADLKTLVP
jgi:hypothetical protein